MIEMKNRTAIIAIVFLFAVFVPHLLAQETTAQTLVGHRMVPKSREFSQTLLKQLRLPEGLQIQVFAAGLGNPRMMAVNQDGSVYITRPQQQDVIRLQDNGDGYADSPQTVASGLGLVHGIAIHQGRLYLCTEKELLVADLLPDGSISDLQMLIDDLPDGGQHPKRTIGFAPEGGLFVSVGSSCNACEEPNPEHASILRMNADGSNRSIYADGLRNTIGFDWHPQTGELWGMDHGSDWRGDDRPPEELNRIVEGGDYGWPYCYGKNVIDEFMSKASNGTDCTETEPAVLTYQAHSAPIAMIFYDHELLAEFKGDAFVAMHGSWNRKPPSGYEIVRVDFENGQPVEFKEFVTGFLLEGGKSQFGRPAGLAALPDGSLLISEDANGMIYRVVPKKGQ